MSELSDKLENIEKSIRDVDRERARLLGVRQSLARERDKCKRHVAKERWGYKARDRFKIKFKDTMTFRPQSWRLSSYVVFNRGDVLDKVKITPRITWNGQISLKTEFTHSDGETYQAESWSNSVNSASFEVISVNGKDL